MYNIKANKQTIQLTILTNMYELHLKKINMINVKKKSAW